MTPLEWAIAAIVVVVVVVSAILTDGLSLVLFFWLAVIAFLVSQVGIQGCCVGGLIVGGFVLLLILLAG